MQQLTLLPPLPPPFVPITTTSTISILYFIFCLSRDCKGSYGRDEVKVNPGGLPATLSATRPIPSARRFEPHLSPLPTRSRQKTDTGLPPFSLSSAPSPSFIIITQPILFIRMHLTITSPCLCIHIYSIFLFQYGAYLLRMYGESPTFQFHSLELCYLTSYHSSWRYILLPCVCCIQHVLEIGLYINSVRSVRFKYVVQLHFHNVDPCLLSRTDQIVQ